MTASTDARARAARRLTILGLIIGLWGALVGVGDNVAPVRQFRDSHGKWSAIGSALEELKVFDSALGDARFGEVRKGESGFDELMSIIREHVDVSEYGDINGLFAQERGSAQTIAKRFRVVRVWFGFTLPVEAEEVSGSEVASAETHRLVQDIDLLEAWVREYRIRYYVAWALGFVCVAFLLQLISAVVVPAN